MLANLASVQNSCVFPLESIIGYFNSKFMFQYSFESDKDTIARNAEYLVPGFKVDSVMYVPVILALDVNKPPYPGMKADRTEALGKLKGKRLCTAPILTDILDKTLYGLVPYIPGNNLESLYINKYPIPNVDFQGMIKASKEYHSNGLIHLDLNASNFVRHRQTFQIFITDISLAIEHSRPIQDYVDERAIDYHWSPEIRQGGLITEKSAVYSLGATMKRLLQIAYGFDDFVKDSNWRRWGETITALTSYDPKSRPTFADL